MVCSFCNQEIKPGAKFCQSCGCSIPAEGSQAAPMVAASAAPAAAPFESAPIDAAPVAIPGIDINQAAPAADVAPADSMSVAPADSVASPAEPVSPYAAPAVEIPGIEMPTPVSVAPVADSFASQPAVDSNPYAQNAYAQPNMNTYTQAGVYQQQAYGGYAQPNTYAQPNSYAQPMNNSFAQSNIYGQNNSSAFVQNSYNNQSAFTQSGAYTAPQSAAAFAAAEYAKTEEVNKASTPILIFGIVSLVLSISGAFSLVGLIFGIVSLVKASALEKLNGYLEGKGKTGKGLSIAGVILGAIGTLFGAIISIIFIVLIIEEM